MGGPGGLGLPSPGKLVILDLLEVDDVVLIPQEDVQPGPQLWCSNSQLFCMILHRCELPVSTYKCYSCRRLAGLTTTLWMPALRDASDSEWSHPPLPPFSPGWQPFTGSLRSGH